MDSARGEDPADLSDMTVAALAARGTGSGTATMIRTRREVRMIYTHKCFFADALSDYICIYFAMCAHAIDRGGSLSPNRRSGGLSMPRTSPSKV
jgi:hypothetical protein